MPDRALVEADCARAATEMGCMKPFLFCTPVALLLSLNGTLAQEVKAKETPKVEGDVQVLARGPVHEAFAQPWQKNPHATAAVKREPPPPVAEQPPDQRPDGDRVQWIPGYWQWDAERDNFLWVSGAWRKA